MSKLKKLAGLDSALNLETKQESQRGYKSGATYNGQIIDNNKFGKGIFVWPNGDRYDGSYEFNYRHGYGIFTDYRFIYLISIVTHFHFILKGFKLKLMGVHMKGILLKIKNLAKEHINLKKLRLVL